VLRADRLRVVPGNDGARPTVPKHHGRQRVPVGIVGQRRVGHVTDPGAFRPRRQRFAGAVGRRRCRFGARRDGVRQETNNRRRALRRAPLVLHETAFRCPQGRGLWDCVVQAAQRATAGRKEGIGRQREAVVWFVGPSGPGPARTAVASICGRSHASCRSHTPETTSCYCCCQI
jgi:hypothetical protein